MGKRKILTNEDGTLKKYSVSDYKVKKIKHSKNHEKIPYTPPNTPKMDAAMELYNENQLAETMIHFQPQSLEKIQQQVEEKFLLGKFKSPNTASPFSDVPATTIDDKPLKWPLKHTEWLTFSYRCLTNFEKVLTGKITPTWDLVRYRSEKHFKAGSYSAFAPIWLIIINKLADDKTKQLAYKLIHQGLTVFDNQAAISIKNKLPYRASTQLATTKTINPYYMWLHSQLPEDMKMGNSFVLSGTKYNIYSHYPTEVSQENTEEGKIWKKKPFYQANSSKTTLCPDEITQSIEDWIETGAVQYVGRDKEVESPIRAGVVMALNIKPDKIKTRITIGAQP